MSDVIGLAGFDYEFNTLIEGDSNELATAVQALMSPPTGVSALSPVAWCWLTAFVQFNLLPLLQQRFPILRHIVRRLSFTSSIFGNSPSGFSPLHAVEWKNDREK